MYLFENSCNSIFFKLKTDVLEIGTEHEMENKHTVVLKWETCLLDMYLFDTEFQLYSYVYMFQELIGDSQC